MSPRRQKHTAPCHSNPTASKAARCRKSKSSRATLAAPMHSADTNDSRADGPPNDSTVENRQSLGKYQLYPFTDDELDRAVTILTRDAVIRPGLVRTDEEGQVIFGHVWAEAANQCGISRRPEIVRYEGDEATKWRDALEHSFRGCALDNKQRQAAVRRYFLESGDVETSDRNLAAMTGVGRDKVGEIRKELEAAGKIKPALSRRGPNGVLKPMPRVTCETEKQHQTVLENLEYLPPSPRYETLDFNRAKSRIDREKNARNQAEKIASLPPFDADIANEYGLFHCDFRNILELIDLQSIDIVLIDPPYCREWLKNWDDFAQVCFEILKPGGTLVGWPGRDVCFDAKISCRKAGFDLWPDIRCRYKAMVHRGISTQGTCHVQQCYGEPLILCTKDKPTWRKSFPDEFNSAGKPDNALHKWAKHPEDVGTVLNFLSIPGDNIADLTAGSFTTAVVCQGLGLHFVGCDIDEDCIRIGLERLKNEGQKRAG